MIIRTGKTVLSRCFKVDLLAAWALSNEVGYHALARFVLGHAKPPAEEVVSQPKLVRIDDVADAVARDLVDPLAAMHAIWLPLKPHDPRDLVQRRPVCGAEGRQRVAEIERVLGVAIEVGARREPRRRDPVNHRAVAQDGRSKPLPLKVTSWGLSSAILSTKAAMSSLSVAYQLNHSPTRPLAAA